MENISNLTVINGLQPYSSDNIYIYIYVQRFACIYKCIICIILIPGVIIPFIYKRLQESSYHLYIKDCRSYHTIYIYIILQELSYHV